MVQSQSIQDAVDHFRKEKWVAALIDAPGTTVSMSPARRNTDLNGGPAESHDQLFRSALNNDDSIPYMLLIHPQIDQGTETREVEAAASSGALDGSRFSILSLSLLLDLRKGIQGFNRFAHGGFLGAIMDEAMGGLIFTNYEYQRDREEAAVKKGNHWTPPPGVLNMTRGVRILTAGINIRFQRPLVLPSTVVATARLSRFEGRKIYLTAEVHDAQSQGKGKDKACATCESLWMSVGPPKGKL